MSKAKSPKLLKLPFLNSFQICRPKNPSSMIKTSNLATNANKYNMLSPLKLKSFDISFPSFPTPPPSTPSKVFENNELALPKHSITKDKKKNTCNLPHLIPPKDSQTSTNAKENDTNKTRKTVYSDNSGETDSLFSSPPSFNNSSRDFNHPLKTIYEEEIVGGSKKSVRGRRFRRYGSKEWKEGVDNICGNDRNKQKLNISSSSSSSEDYYSCHSFVVVKRSVDPYEDFKKSMCEMILEKQMSEPGELEQLLMSFLSLNSRMHHKVIIEAFTEILKEVFCG